VVLTLYHLNKYLLFLLVCGLLSGCSTVKPDKGAIKQLSYRIGKLEDDNLASRISAIELKLVATNVGRLKAVSKESIKKPEDKNFIDVWINVNNSKAKYPVRLYQKADGGFIGPKGEHYKNAPSAGSLIRLYGF